MYLSFKKLKVSQTYDWLYKIATEAGEGSVERKINNMAVLLNGLDRLSVKYVVRIPLGKLRLGFCEVHIFLP